MRKDDFSPGAPGRLVAVGEGRWAFVPHPLPPKLGFGPELVRVLSEADRAPVPEICAQAAAFGMTVETKDGGGTLVLKAVKDVLKFLD
jgi:hypothetical protein